MQSGVLVFTLYLTSQLVDNDLILIKKNSHQEITSRHQRTHIISLQKSVMEKIYRPLSVAKIFDVDCTDFFTALGIRGLVFFTCRHASCH